MHHTVQMESSLKGPSAGCDGKTMFSEELKRFLKNVKVLGRTPRFCMGSSTVAIEGVPQRTVEFLPGFSEEL